MTVRTVLAGVGLAFVLLCIGLLLRRDLPRWRGTLVAVPGRVIGYRSMRHQGTVSYAPVYAFAAEGAEHEVVDQVYAPRREHEEGTIVELRYPVGRPDLARPDRPFTFGLVYAALVAMAAILTGVLAGVLE